MLAFRVPASSQELGAGVRVTAQAPGELHVSGGGPFLTGHGLMDGGRAVRGSLPVKNVTRGPVNVRVRAREGGHGLDDSLHLELRAGGRRLAAGPLSQLRRWSRPVRVERAGDETINARAWIPAGAEGFAGRHAAVQLQLEANLVRISRR